MGARVSSRWMGFESRAREDTHPACRNNAEAPPAFPRGRAVAQPRVFVPRHRQKAPVECVQPGPSVPGRLVGSVGGRRPQASGRGPQRKAPPKLG
jgi:hypothetical protein